MAVFISFAPRAERDYRDLISNQASRKQVDKALDGLTVGAANLNIKAVSGRPPWLRMRAGDYRVLCRPLTGNELAARGVAETTGYIVARVIHRSELHRAIATL